MFDAPDYDGNDENDFNSWNDAERMAFHAYELYEDGQMNLALAQLQQAIGINPANSAWYFNAGLTLDALECFDEAIEAYKRALEISPDDPEIINSLAVDYTRTGFYDLAIETFEQIQVIDPSFEPCYCNRIITYTEMELHEKAEEMFYLAQLINPDCPICFYNIGNSLFSRRNYKRAVWCWQRTAMLEPMHPQINFRIAQAYWADGNRPLARIHFLDELRQNPGDKDVLLDFGIFMLEAGEKESATEKFNRILELDPDFAPALFYLGEMALAKDDQTEAIHLFTRALKHDPDLPGPRFRLAQLAIAADREEDALRWLKTECTLDITDKDILLAMGSLLMKLGEIGYATDCFLQIVDEDQKNIEAFAMLGKCLAAQEEYCGSCQFLEHAISLGSKDPQVYADLACVYIKLGQLASASKILADGRQLDPKNKDIKALTRVVRFQILDRNLRQRWINQIMFRMRLLTAIYKCKVNRMIHRS